MFFCSELLVTSVCLFLIGVARVYVFLACGIFCFFFNGTFAEFRVFLFLSFA